MWVSCSQHSVIGDDKQLFQMLGLQQVSWKDDCSGEAPLFVRTVWNIYSAPAEFHRWLEQHGHRCRVNTEAWLRFGLDKIKYRQVLGGIPFRTSEKLARRSGWTDVVVKPAIGAFGHGVRRVRADEMQSKRVQTALRAMGEYIVEPFVSSIVSRGELSIVFVAGELSHCVRKVPPAGDIRVQGGKISPVDVKEIPAQALKRARKAMQDAQAHVGSPVGLARVDLVFYEQQWELSEFECVDPELFWRHASPEKVEKAAAFIAETMR